MVDNGRMLAFSRGQGYLRECLDRVQRELEKGQLTDDAIRVQLGILDEVKQKSGELEI